MKATHWEIIQKNLPLLNDVQAEDISNILFENKVFSLEDNENITKEKTTCKKMEKLLQILRNKPAPVNAFEKFLEALKKDDCYSHIVEALEKTPVTSNSHFVTKGDPTELEEPVRKVLLQHYVNQPGKTKLIDIIETLQRNVKCHGGYNWKKEKLSDFICQVFATVTVIPELVPSCKKKVLFVKDLIAVERFNKTVEVKKDTANLQIEQNPNIFKDITEKETILTLESADSLKISKYDPEELKKFLSSYFEEKLIKSDIPTVFEEQQITGEIFISLTSSNIKEICPSASYGAVSILTKLILTLNSVDPTHEISLDQNVNLNSALEKHRDFNTDVHDNFNYIQGRIIDIKKSQVKRKLLPLPYFCLLEEADFQEFEESALQMLSSKVIQFTSACLNNSQDGTVYFGIDPETGFIKGLPVQKEEVINSLSYYIDRAFPDENLKHLVNATMRLPAFIPVFDSSFNSTGKFVVEVDVVASSAFVQNTNVKTKLKNLSYLPASAKKSRKCGYFTFDEHGDPTLVGYDKLQQFFNQVELEAKLRKAEEETVQLNRPENLRQKLLNLLTGGREKLDDVIYPFILLSTVDAKMDKNYILKNMLFIKHLDTDVIFDFDSTGSSKGIYHCYNTLLGELMTVLTLDNFSNPENSKFIDNIDTDKIPWVFCNGYEPSSIKPLSPTEWNKQIRSAFQKALKHFEKNRSADRILIIICLFSKDYETMLEGCEEVLTSFPNKWVVYAETEHIAKMWKKEMIQRKKVDEKDASDRFVVGMTWEQINDTIEQVTTHAVAHGCILPQAVGSFTKPIPEKKLKSWCDVELLSSSDPEVGEDISKKVLEKFYKGESVDWLNFWFEGQVLQRSHDRHLSELVKKALTEEAENKVSTVIIFHHPGSGATTSAKLVLWELRQQYRCCVIRRITEDTIDQLQEIRKFREPSTSPKPVLILVDNEDEEKYRQLKQNLEVKCKLLSRENPEVIKVFFTMLFCIRKASLPQQILDHQMLLEQKLTKQEQKTFGKKHKQLTSEYEKNKENIDPKYLISFNILKNDFSPEYIRKSVKEFIKGIKDEREITLLSYIALLNKYDPQFRSIPVSCFDAVFWNKSENYKKLPNAFKRCTYWEANLSQAVQVLLSISPQKKTGASDARISLRVLHRLVADSLLDNLITDKNSLCDIMHSLINSIIFDHDTEDFMHLENIVGDIMKRREFNQSDGKKEMFSPFITQVNKDSGDEVSIQLFCDFFDRNHDPFIAQQIARFYYYLKNWDKAESYAQRATELKPKCSFLWDTFGRVYKEQLRDEYDKIKKTMDKDKKHDNNFVKKLINLAKKAIFYFKKVQELTEESLFNVSENNLAGYFGELQTQIIFLQLLEKCQCFKNRSHLMKCLVSKDFKENCFRFLNSDEITFLSQLEDNCMNTLRVLDEQYLQVREDAQFDVAVYSGTYGRELQNFVSLMFDFHDYFGEPKDFSYIKNLPEPEASMHRWRIALKHGAMSLNLLLRFRAEGIENKGEKQFAKKLSTIYKVMLPNLNSGICEFDYHLAMLNAVTLLVVEGLTIHECKQLTYPQVLDWTKKLLDCKQPNEKRPYVEPYMYFVMFNFPSEKRSDFSLCTIKKLEEACEKWRKAYIVKFGDAEARTLFYLAQNDLLMDLVHSDTFPMEGRDNWDHPEMRKYLVLYSGTVEIGGKKVNVKITRDNNTLYLSIPTSYTVKKNLWQKETYFFVGFSFSGPKAYGIPQEPPETIDDIEQDVPCSVKYLSKDKSSFSFRASNEHQKSFPQLRGVSKLIDLKRKLDLRQALQDDALQGAWEDHVADALKD
ncbi:sterile alpha motif domain-containing protein 9 [Biomphalaria pfeifferi]|uniref:Sterile alpha motif domain-containing protein 9 n=1 Tax=Biomphalaria pfeifferi TaxID=112525 RepID=A0AAD8FIL6_BIOPF|nr:sterile alpha motif domain-containing protein 9 [Biomphalaria pfeifferi]